MNELDRMFNDLISDVKNEVKKRQYVALIIDESGSMMSLTDVARNTFNEQIQMLKDKGKDIETFITLVKFNHNVDTMIFNKPSKNILEFEEEDYLPNGSTALYDAIGNSIELIQPLMDKDRDIDSAVLFLIVTDGYENASLKYTQKKLKSIIEVLEKTKKWTFTFLCSNIDPMTAVVDLSFQAGNTVSFVASAQGMRGSSKTMSKGIETYYESRGKGATCSSDFYNNSDTEKKEE